MRGRWRWIVIVANLLVLVALAFVYPHLMVSPGPLVPAHASLNSDCFACHVPLRGAATDRCVACHAVPGIGLRTTKGVVIPVAQAGKPTASKISFHQELTEQDCMACHSDHASPRLTHRGRKQFSHALLRLATRERCAACHAPPGNAMHRNLTAECSQCHTPEAWKPAAFDHEKSFLLDKHHDVTCVTCHAGDDYAKYTCYGCHEHTAANVRRKHIEEGIQDFENCVKCHRSAHGEPEGRGGREGGSDRQRGRRD